jgi:hypothetical protein
MKQILGFILLGGLILGLGTAHHEVAAQAPPEQAGPDSVANLPDEEDTIPDRDSVHGMRERRQFRIIWWAAHLKGDMKRIYETYGYPSSRYREEVMGRIVEKWTYIDDGKMFSFRDSRLTEKRQFNPGSFKGYNSRAVTP